MRILLRWCNLSMFSFSEQYQTCLFSIGAKIESSEICTVLSQALKRRRWTDDLSLMTLWHVWLTWLIYGFWFNHSTWSIEFKCVRTHSWWILIHYNTSHLGTPMKVVLLNASITQNSILKVSSYLVELVESQTLSNNSS